MKTYKVTIFLCCLVATILGIFAQDIAYYLHAHFSILLPSTFLTILTLTSIFLFFISLLFVYFFYKEHKLLMERVYVYLLTISLVGGLTSLWSLFILAMWMG